MVPTVSEPLSRRLCKAPPCLMSGIKHIHRLRRLELRDLWCHLSTYYSQPLFLFLSHTLLLDIYSLQSYSLTNPFYLYLRKSRDSNVSWLVQQFYFEKTFAIIFLKYTSLGHCFAGSFMSIFSVLVLRILCVRMIWSSFCKCLFSCINNLPGQTHCPSRLSVIALITSTFRYRNRVLWRQPDIFPNFIFEF